MTYRNDNGSDRQGIIRDHCRIGDAVDIVPDPSNPAHAKAMRVVLRKTGMQIGHLPRDLAELVHVYLANGLDPVARIVDLVGGGPDLNHGVRIRIDVLDQSMDRELARLRSEILRLQGDVAIEIARRRKLKRRIRRIAALRRAASLSWIRNLPEWAQPVAVGFLLAAAVVVLAAVAALLSRI